MTYFVSWIYLELTNGVVSKVGIGNSAASIPYDQELHMSDIERIQENIKEKYHLEHQPAIINFQKIGDEPNGSGKEL